MRVHPVGIVLFLFWANHKSEGKPKLNTPSLGSMAQTLRFVGEVSPTSGFCGSAQAEAEQHKKTDVPDILNLT
jgi:hypothetical protein